MNHVKVLSLLVMPVGCGSCLLASLGVVRQHSHGVEVLHIAMIVPKVV